MVTKEELGLMLQNLESARIEKTVSVADVGKFGEAICAFANDLPGFGLPGYLVLGVRDSGERSGLKVDERLLQTLMSFRTDGRIVPPPLIVVSKFEFPDGDVAVVEVRPSYQPPVRFNGSVWIRIGPRKGKATEAEERVLSEKRSSFARTFDTLPCFESKLDDLSLEIFQIQYLPQAIDEETLQSNHRIPIEQLASLKFFDLRANCPTNAGILMFGKNPRFWIQGAFIQYVKFAGVDEVSDFVFEKRFEGDLATQMRVIDEFIKAQIVKKVQHTLTEDYQYNYPLSAIRELVFNAIIHRDYQSNAPIKFYEFSDRIEITNPGGLYGDARPENFPNTNDYRNPILAESAKNLGFINAFNVGIKRAMSALQKNGNPTPKFIFEQSTSFGVVIFGK